MELIRRRREEASGACPPGFTRSGGNCVPIGAAPQPVAAAQPAPAPAQAVAVTTTTTTGPAPAAAPAAGAQPKRIATPRPKAASAPTQVAQASTPQPVVRSAPQPQPAAPAYRGSIKDSYPDAPTAGVVRVHGGWIEGYHDREKHTNLNPAGGPDNNPTRRLTTGGFVGGVDVGQYTIGSSISGFQIGLLGGYNQSRARFSDTTSVKFQPSLGTTNLTRSTDQQQNVEGGFTGLYGAIVHGGFSADLAFKVDFFDVDQRSVDRLLEGCTDVFSKFEQTSMTNYVVASNFNYRFDLSSTHYIEPTVGVRYTHVNYGDNAGALGLADGDVFRVQGGLRFGWRRFTPDGWIWNTALTGLLYSDVSMSGLVVPGTATTPATPLVDEGKLRAMGVLETRANIGRGYTLYGAAEVRGGDDVIGYGGRLGVRYEW